MTPISTWDRLVMIRTVVGEARGEGAAGKAAVAWVIRNRFYSGRFGMTLANVCLAPKQFSCWNDGDVNRNVLAGYPEDSEVYRQIAEIVDGVLAGEGTDMTAGSCHYHTRAVSPSWARDHQPVAEIGAHLYYNSVR